MADVRPTTDVTIYDGSLVEQNIDAGLPQRLGQPAATTGTITTSTGTVSANVRGYGTATVVVAGTYAGVNFTFEGSVDNGTTWFTVNAVRTDTINLVESTTGVLPSNTIRAWDLACSGWTNTRVRATAYTSGTANIAIAPIAASINPKVGVALVPQITGGLTTFHLISAGTTNATVIKSSPGQLYGWYVYNSNASARHIKFHNQTTTPTAGTGVVMTISVPPTSGANVEITNGIAFGTGIAITTTTGIADADTAAVTASDLNINLFYK